MKHSRYIQIVSIFILLISSLSGNAAISTKNHINQDSALLIIHQEYEKKYIEEAIKKGDQITYRDTEGKSTVQVVGFQDNQVVVKNIKTKRIYTIEPSAIISIRKYTQEGAKKWNAFKIVSGSLLGIITAISLTAETSVYVNRTALFIILCILTFPILLLISGIIYLRSLKKRPIFSIKKGYRFELKK